MQLNYALLERIIETVEKQNIETIVNEKVLNPLNLNETTYNLSESKSKNDYDIAISFAGENRAIAEEIAEKLTSSGIKVFYDSYEKATL